MYSARDHLGYPVLACFPPPFSGGSDVTIIFPEFNVSVKINLFTFWKYFAIEDGLN